MNLTKYAALDVQIMEYSKVNNQFSLGRARVFYEGPNVNRTIISPEVARELIKTIPGTPIVGRFNSESDDFEGHGEGQIAYGFVPLEPNPMKVEVTEDVYGLPVKRTYYEVDAIIWDGRFPEAKKILDEEKSLSMELNPDTLEGEFEIYDDKTYLKITNAEFYGITVLGDGHTPCFKDAKFLQTYTSMLSAYEALMKGQESNMGGKDMPITEEEVVEVKETEATINNEEISVDEASEENVSVEEAKESTPTEDGVEEGTEENTEVEETVDSETEESAEFVSKDEDEANSEKKKAGRCESDDEKANSEKKKRGECEAVEDEETEEQSTESEEPEVEEAEADSEKYEETEALKAEIEELKGKLEVYENAAKEELISKFSSKINDSDFMGEIKENLGKYSVDELKSTLGAKLAEQVLVEETSDEEKVNGMVYSFNGVAKKQSNQGWQALVRATKEAHKK